MQADCEAEVRRLHRFLEDWMTGALPNTAAVFDREYALVFAPSVVLVDPGGVIYERAGILEWTRAAYGMHADPEKAFTIWIDNVHTQHRHGDLCLAMYEEWQRLRGIRSCRLATALFSRGPGTPHGVAWLHAHETWLAGEAGVSMPGTRPSPGTS